MRPFGQDEAIDIFLRAYNADFLALAHEWIDQLIEMDHRIETVDISGVLLPEDGGPDEVARLTHEGLNEDFQRLYQSAYIEPKLDTMKCLPRGVAQGADRSKERAEHPDSRP